MPNRYRLFRRHNGIYFVQDNNTGRQESLRTRNKNTAHRIFHAHNEAHQQPFVNLQIARAYLTAHDPVISKRTWQAVMEAMSTAKHGETLRRWLVAIKSKAYDCIRHLPLLETRSEHFLQVLDNGGVSANVFLRRMHNFALDMNWLPSPVIVRKQWPQPN